MSIVTYLTTDSFSNILTHLGKEDIRIVNVVCKWFNKVSSDKNEIEWNRLRVLVRDLDSQLQEKYGKAIIGIPAKAYTVKINPEYLGNYANCPITHGASVLYEKLVDALSAFTEEEIDFLTVPEEYSLLCIGAKRREYAHLFLYPFTGTCIVPDRSVDPSFGVRFQSLGLDGNFYPCVSCWIVNEKVNNWNRHSYKGKIWISEDLPVQFFIGKREGDIVFIESKGIEFKIKLKQRPHRYGGIDFEEQLVRNCKNYSTISHTGMSENDQEEEWNTLIQKLKESYNSVCV